MFRRIWAAVWGHLPRGAWGNADPRRAHQDRGEREVPQHGLDLPRHHCPLLLQFLHLTSDSRNDELHCRCRWHDDGLLRERCEDLVDQRFGIAARMRTGETQDPGPTCGLEPGGAAELLQQVQHEPGSKTAAGEDALERGMDLSQQRSDPVQCPGSLVGEVLVKAREDLERGENLVVSVDLAKRVGLVEQLVPRRVECTRVVSCLPDVEPYDDRESCVHDAVLPWSIIAGRSHDTRCRHPRYEELSLIHI